MSTINSQPQQTVVQPQHSLATVQRVKPVPAKKSSGVEDALASVEAKIAPVWPLKDYVAVNPYMGVADQKFLFARKFLRSVSDLELLMSVDYYRRLFSDGDFCRADIDAAVDELVADGVAGAERIDVNQVVAFLSEPSKPSPAADVEFTKSSNPGRQIRTVAESLDRYTGSQWGRLIRDEVSKHCAAHYDQGQATWSNPWKGLPLYESWRKAAMRDRSFEILGVGGFRKLVATLPDEPLAAVETLLNRLKVPQRLWADFLLCHSLSMPGWSAWTKYQQRQARGAAPSCTDFAGLLAMRLAYEVALSERIDFFVDWPSVAEQHPAVDPAVDEADQLSDEDLLRYALLKAHEIAFRQRLTAGLLSNESECQPESADARGLAQMVFCIDVRSERIRRRLEATSHEIETFGFAGFFGLPIELVELGQKEGSPQVPALISPHFKVYEELDVTVAASNEVAGIRRSTVRFLRKAWKDFQTSAVSMFAFVETAGLLYGPKLIARTLGLDLDCPSRFDGVPKAQRAQLVPSLRGLNQQGVCTSKQVDMAESMLRGIGIVNQFARLVVFCGHGSETSNNPLKSALDCGACGGHSGEANARLAAKLLNQQYVRQALAERGIEIPEDTHFVAALHNTTTDKLEFFDVHNLPSSREGDLKELLSLTEIASKQAGCERLSVLPGQGVEDLVRRSRDWSEVRPEWGLAGNAAFIAAPRKLTKGFSLDGRVFLHSYDHRRDPSLAVLEQIMTAPLVVANWINMQYYASTVDPIHFGSGNKTVHNVVGRFGVFSGNGGDLTTGLPWQSIHDGERYQHHALRLLAVVAAPRTAIEAILEKHQNVAALLTNGWLQLIAIDDDRYYRYSEQRQWEELLSSKNQNECAPVAS